MSSIGLSLLIFFSVLETVIVIFIMKKHIELRDIVPYLIIAALAFFLFKELTKEIEVIEVPVRVEVPVPVVEVQFDTVKEPVYIPYEKRVIDTVYYNGSNRDSLFIEAITIREYKETVEDDTITINLYAKVQGFMKEYQIDYKTKPHTVVLDTVLSVPIPKRSSLYVGGEIGVPADYLNTTFKVSAFLKTKKNRLYSVGISSDKKIWLGMYFVL